MNWGILREFVTKRGGVKNLIKHVARGQYVSHSFVRDSDESRRHKNMISKLACAYHRSGFEVKADHIKDFESPSKFCMIFPDIVAEKKGKKILIEVETEGSIGSERDKRQRRAFGDWAKKSKDRDFRREITIK